MKINDSKKKLKVFISGPMKGMDNMNKDEFDKAEKLLREHGYSPFNPAWMCNLDEMWTHDDCMKFDLAALSCCDAIYQLDGWKYSEGAYMEYIYAVKHELIIMRESEEFKCCICQV